MKTARSSILLLCLAIAPALLAQTAIKFNGSSTTHKMLLPYADAIASAHKAKIVFVPNGTGRGLEDLAAGRADVAMITGDLSYFAQLLNEAKAGTIDPAKARTFRLADLEKTAATAIVHPSNPVAKLTHAQLQGLFSGKITNWKEVGGPDLAVVPILPSPSDGVFGSFTVAIMKGVPFAATARKVTLATDLPKIVAQLPGAIAFLSIANAVGEVRKAAPEPQFIPPNYLVTLGEPAEPVKSLIADFQAQVK
ncbi:MAG: substrate-binding domain-containing protein [Opitutae bacterium]|nr:substrate-binding domain-containing protein [Opitutae bacterium]